MRYVFWLVVSGTVRVLDGCVRYVFRMLVLYGRLTILEGFVCCDLTILQEAKDTGERTSFVWDSIVFCGVWYVVNSQHYEDLPLAQILCFCNVPQPYNLRVW